MNNFHELLINRRSIRRYKPQPIDAESVKLILEAALMAPTSKSSRSWQFVAVEDKEMLEKLSKCKPAGAAPIAKAALAIVVTDDPSLSEAWIEDASVAAAYMQLQAADLGLGSCWIQVRGRYTAENIPSEEYVQNLLGIPQSHPVVCVVTFGYKDEERKKVDTSKLLWEKVHIASWKGEE